MRSLITHIVLFLIICGRQPCFANNSGDIISNVETAIVSIIESHYGREKDLNATEFLRFLEHVVPFKTDSSAQENVVCGFETITEACSATENIANCKEAIIEKVNLLVFNG